MGCFQRRLLRKWQLRRPRFNKQRQFCLLGSCGHHRPPDFNSEWLKKGQRYEETPTLLMPGFSLLSRAILFARQVRIST
jgi:hypothetical protein